MKTGKTVIGLMSGTSADGVDAAVCRISWNKKSALPAIKILGAARTAYTARLRQRILELGENHGGTAAVCELNVKIGEVFARAANKAVALAETLGAAPPSLIGSHGQTVHHMPRRRATLQIGEAAVIAARTGLPTWSDFRQADLARGGQGAPLAPLIHLPLFADKKLGVAVVNIGGVANVTHLPPDARGPGAVIAYDTGPGCMIIDYAVAAMGAGRFDKNGKMAASGQTNPKLLRRLAAHPYFRRKPPKSTGRETFGKTFLEWAGIKRQTVFDKDMVSTLTELTAWSITAGIARLGRAGRKTDRIVVCGGGAKNTYLMRRIEALAPSEAEVMTSGALGVPCQMVEPALCALLAFYADRGARQDLGAVTGAARPAILGKLAPA